MVSARGEKDSSATKIRAIEMKKQAFVPRFND